MKMTLNSLGTVAIMLVVFFVAIGQTIGDELF